VKDEVNLFPLYMLARKGSFLSQASCAHRQGRVNCTELTEKAEFTFFFLQLLRKDPEQQIRGSLFGVI